MTLLLIEIAHRAAPVCMVCTAAQEQHYSVVEVQCVWFW